MSSSTDMCPAVQGSPCHRLIGTSYGDAYESYQDGYGNELNRSGNQHLMEQSLVKQQQHRLGNCSSPAPSPRPSTAGVNDNEQKTVTHYAVADSDDYRKVSGRSEETSDDDRGPPLPPRPQPIAQPGRCVVVPSDNGEFIN